MSLQALAVQSVLSEEAGKELSKQVSQMTGTDSSGRPKRRKGQPKIRHSEL